MEKRKVFKQALDSPFVIKWDQITKEQESKILSELESVNNSKLILGINSLTKQLQDETVKNTVKSIILCKGDLPIMAYNHLPSLCFKTIKIVPLLKNSQPKLQEIIGKTNICAIGIPDIKEYEMLNYLIDGVVDYIDVPWLNSKMYLSTRIKIIETTQGEIKKKSNSNAGKDTSMTGEGKGSALKAKRSINDIANTFKKQKTK
ncbi:hypothetical protein HDV06_005518 [Boothiomyces sp. JEL0866]|nr:hypothetical protein HDV06_005518 [Boothiomyces sp. JEL0866]